MSTRNNLHRWALASAVAAMLAAAAPGAFAQDNTQPGAATPPATSPASPDTTGTTTPPATTTPDAGATGAGASGTGTTGSGTSGSTASTPMSPGMSSGSSTSGGPSMSPDPSTLPTDYKVLSNRVFDATNLEQARARGLSDTEIATIIKISEATGFSFNEVAGMVERGETFPQIATEYNLRLADIYSVDKEKQQISDYDALNKYANSLGKNSSMMAMPMSSPSTPTPPMAPMTSPASSTPATSATSSATPTLDIVDTAMAAKNLTTFVKAVQIAGLVETLKGAGPFTVFAPDNKAFSKLPAGALDALEADPVKLKQVLTYHVIPANIMASDAMAMTSPTSPPTVEGATLQVTTVNKGKKARLMVNNATVTKADIQASNGTIHIINQVLMPPVDATTSTTPPADTTTPPAAPAPAPMDAPPATPPAAPATPPATTDPNATPAPAAPATDPNAPANTAPGTDPNAPATTAPGTAPATGAGNTPTQ